MNEWKDNTKKEEKPVEDFSFSAFLKQITVECLELELERELKIAHRVSAEIRRAPVTGASHRIASLIAEPA